MDVSSINSDLIRGNVTTIILKALLDEDRYGYDILREIEVKSGGQYKLKQPTLYSCLKRLEKQGLISSYWGDESDTEGGRRRYYALTEAGKNYLKKMQSEYEYSRTILDSLLSEDKFDFENEDAPFDINSLRPYTKRGGDEDEKEIQKVVQAGTTTTPEVIRGVPSETQKTSSQPSTYKSVYGNDFSEKESEKPAESEKAMFTPLDKGASSYDTDYRHTSSSVSDMLSRIDDILSAKPAETKSETAPAPEKQEIKTNILGKPIVNNAEYVAPEQEERPKTPEAGDNDNKIVEKTTPVPYSEPTEEEIELAKAILLETENIKTDVDDEDHLLRRDAAKRALSIGSYADNSKNIVEKYDEAQKLFEKKPKEEEPPAEEPVDERSAREKLFGTQQNTGDTENPDRAAERAAAAKVLFDKYNKTNEEKPADPSPYPDPYMIFDKYSNPGKPQEIKIQYDPKEVFSKYGEQDKTPEKRYDPKEIFDKYNGKAPVEQPEEKHFDPKEVFDKYHPERTVAPEPEKHYDPKDVFDKYNKKEEPAPKESARVNIERSPVAPASSFSFRQNDDTVNYRDAFSGLRNTTSQSDDDVEIKQKPASSIDLKTKLFSEGYKLRPYSRENTENYYSLNYIKKNRLNRDCYAILYALICLEVLIGFAIFREKFSPMAYASVCIIALVVPAVPFVIWTMNPDKRVHANYNFKTSILNRFMLYLNLLVIVCLVGFFGFGANINNVNSMMAPIIIPAILLLNIPLSACVYCILYKTKKYHIS